MQSEISKFIEELCFEHGCIILNEVNFIEEELINKFPGERAKTTVIVNALKLGIQSDIKNLMTNVPKNNIIELETDKISEMLLVPRNEARYAAEAISNGLILEEALENKKNYDIEINEYTLITQEYYDTYKKVKKELRKESIGKSILFTFLSLVLLFVSVWAISNSSYSKIYQEKLLQDKNLNTTAESTISNAEK